MSTISTNLRYLRKQKSLTQGDLAEKLGVTRSVIGAYEEARAEPKLITMQNIANFFGISIDQLVAQDLAAVAEASIQGKPMPRTESAGGQDLEGRKLRVLSITVDSQDRENIELVPEKAAAGYLDGYADPEYLEELPKFHLPMLPQGTYRAFEITGDSMLPLTSGSTVIGEYVENWRDIRSGQTYLLLTQEGMVYKRVQNNIDATGRLKLVSDNAAYPPYEVSADEVMEVWKAKAYLSLSFPDSDISLQKLAGMMLDLQAEVIKLQGKE